MGSILTNTGAMVALQTMRGINRGMETTQAQIATGLKVGSAKDNAATWAISKVMESDVAGFKSIKESLALGSSTVNVARNAAETTTKLLTEIKEKIVLAQEQNVDREKIQADIEQLRGQITSVINSAQFNGLNLVKGDEAIEVLSSLDRSAENVQASRISVARNDLTQDSFQASTDPADITTVDAETAPTGTGLSDGVYNAGGNDALEGLSYLAIRTGDAGGAIAENSLIQIGNVTLELAGGAGVNTSQTRAEHIAEAINNNAELAEMGITATARDAIDADGNAVAGWEVVLTRGGSLDGLDFNFTSLDEVGDITISSAQIDAGADPKGANVGDFTASATFEMTGRVGEYDFTGLGEGTEIRVDLGSGPNSFEFVADVRRGEDVGNAIDRLLTQINRETGLSAEAVLDANDNATGIRIANATGSDLKINVTTTAGEAAGGLVDLATIDVTDDVSRAEALDQIEVMIQTSINAASSFGQVQGRIEIQQDFVSGLMDTLRTGIGALVDADMEEASARLQALQVQQQLGIQSLSIANQQPQNILALFR